MLDRVLLVLVIFFISFAGISQSVPPPIPPPPPPGLPIDGLSGLLLLVGAFFGVKKIFKS